MCELKSYFAELVSNVRPTQNQRDDMRDGHKTLRERLRADTDLKPIIISDFLQGSYRRSTAIRPKGDSRSDVDIIVVTNLSEDVYTPAAAMKLFEPFLDKHYKGKWKTKGRSFGIELSYVDLDLVITSAPSEADVEKLKSNSVRYISDIEAEPDWSLTADWLPRSERPVDIFLKQAAEQPQWKLEPLRIPDRDADEWDDTHPLEQISWTVAKNKICNRFFLGIVRSIKWIRRVREESFPKYPKGYPLEHLIGESCPDDVQSFAAGITETLERIAATYADHARNETVPFMPDRGVPAHNVLHRVTGADFAQFHAAIEEAAGIARQALDEEDEEKSVNLWRSLFGDKFPPYKGGAGSGGGGSSRSFTPPSRPAKPTAGTYA